MCTAYKLVRLLSRFISYLKNEQIKLHFEGHQLATICIMREPAYHKLCEATLPEMDVIGEGEKWTDNSGPVKASGAAARKLYIV